MRWSLPTCILLGVSLLAQAPATAPKAAKPPEPAIVFLLRAPRALDVETFRKGYATVVGGAVGDAPTATGAWAAADGESLRGGRDGVAWRVERADKQELPEAALAHLGEGERKTQSSHAARLVVRSGPVADAAAASAVYRVLAGVAAPLLARDVIAIGAAAHGTFVTFERGVDGTRKLLLGDDPVRALAPIASTSLVVFLRGPREFDETKIAKAIGDEFGVEMTSRADAEDNFVVVADKNEMCMVRVAGENVLLTMRPRLEGRAAGKEPDELRVRTALAEHRAMLHVGASGAIDAASEAARRRVVARIVAALWGDDMMMISWHCSLALIPVGMDLRKQLRSDDPVAASLADVVVPIVVSTDEAAMAKAIAEARANWTTAVEHHRGGGELSAKFPFAARKGGHEHIWVSVKKIDGDTVRGVLGNEPFDVEGLKLGSEVVCKVADLSDWIFLRDGKMVGGYTVRVLQEQQKQKGK